MLLALLVGGAHLLSGVGESGLRASIRATATSSLALFLAAFVASSWNALSPSPVSKWLLRNRRYLGLSFALSQAVHLGAILALAASYPQSMGRGLSSATLVGGTLGYVMTALMAATSTDGAVKRLGRSRWKTLHKGGMYLFWGIFVFSYLPRFRSPLYLGFLLALAAAVGVRAVAAAKRRRPGSAAVEGVSPSAK